MLKSNSDLTEYAQPQSVAFLNYALHWIREQGLGRVHFAMKGITRPHGCFDHFQRSSLVFKVFKQVQK